MKNKIFFVLIVIVLSFASVFAIPQKQVEAVGFGLAIPGGITLGAGTYALGALGLAGIVGLAGYAEYEEEINAHAKGVWEGGTQTAKDSLNVSIEAAKGLGNGVVNLQGDFINFMESKLDAIGTNIATLKLDPVAAETGESFELYKLPNGSGYQLLAISGYGMEVYRYSTGLTNKYPSSAIMINSDRYGSYVGIKGVNGSLDIKVKWSVLGVKDHEEASALANSLNTVAEFNQFLTKYASMSIQFYATTGTGSVSSSVDVYNDVRPKVQEAWEGMRDAGLVLPVDSAIPLSSVDGSPLTYNPTADNYTGIDGGVYEGTPAWAFPQPKIRVANPDIPNAVPTTGVYVDTPVLTGNPAYDDAIINNPAIPKTTTNVQTGVTVGNPDIAITEPVPPVDGGGGTPPEDGASCAKLKMPIFSPLKEQFSISFPFSIPWDIGRAINAAFSEIGDEKPEFKLDLKLMDKKHTINITLPKMFDDWKPFTDSLLLFIFDVLIMFGIYRFVKGAGS